MLEKLNNELAKARVIASFESDEKKLELLETINDEYGKAEIIASLSDEEVRINLMKTINLIARPAIIETLSDDSIKETELREVLEKETLRTWKEKIRYSSYITPVIRSFKNPEKRIEFLPFIDKLEFLHRDKFGIEYHKAKVIATLENDEEKIEFLQKISDEDGKALIIISLKNEDIKIKFLELLMSDDARAEVIKSLSDDDKKLELMSGLEEKARVYVMSSLKDDKRKLKLLKKIKDDRLRFFIIESLESDEEKIKFLQCDLFYENNPFLFFNSYYRDEMIAAIKSDEVKLGLLDTIDDDICKAKVIATLGEHKEKENEKKKEVIEQIETKKDRLEELIEEEKKLNNKQKRNTLIEKK